MPVQRHRLGPCGPSSFSAVGFYEQPFLGAAVEFLTLKHLEAFALGVRTSQKNGVWLLFWYRDSPHNRLATEPFIIPCSPPPPQNYPLCCWNFYLNSSMHIEDHTDHMCTAQGMFSKSAHLCKQHPDPNRTQPASTPEVPLPPPPGCYPAKWKTEGISLFAYLFINLFLSSYCSCKSEH